MNFRLINSILSRVIMLQGILLLPSCLVGILYHEWHDVLVYLIVSICCTLFGLLLYQVKPKSSTFYAREGFVAVSLSWIIMSVIGAMPFYFSSDIPDFTDALFEIISGFTTTGSSILLDVEALSHANLFWRSFSHWIGGMGVLVFILAILPMSGGSTMNLMKAESPGPSVGKLVPRIQQTAFLLYAIYFAMTIIELILLLCGSMRPFDALCLTLGTAGTGGFGIRNDSLASYSTYSQLVVTVFMFLFGVNFTFYYFILINKVKDALHMEEVRGYFILYAAASVAIAVNLCLTGTPGFWHNLQQSAFQVASVMTTTGYATADFNLWPTFSKVVLVGLMFIGACAGSTGGGIKISRILIYVKQVRKELMQQIHPRQISVTKLDGKGIEHTTIRSCNVFLMTYGVVFIVSILLISLDGFDFTTTFTSVAATLNNIGPGLDMVGPTGNFASFSVFSKYILMFDMLAGRLEILPMLILFHPATWKK